MCSTLLRQQGGDTLDNYDGLDDLNIEAFHANSKNLSYMNADRPYVT